MSNHLIRAYNQYRKDGLNHFEAFGAAAYHMYNIDRMEELEGLVHHFEKDIGSFCDEPEYNSPLTEFERKQREAGHKQSDFMGGF